MTDQPKAGSWHDVLEKALELSIGAALLTKDAVSKLMDDLVKRGAITKDEGQKLASRMLERGKVQKDKMDAFVGETVERILDKGDVARESRVHELERRIAALEEDLRRVRGE